MEVSNYLQAYHHHFWCYEDAGKVIAIPNGNTIGYSEMILREVVPYLAPQGLPRFSVLLLGMIATNPHGRQALEQVQRIVQHTEGKQPDILAAFRLLDLVTQVPAAYKKGKLRIELLRALFYQAHNHLSTKDSLRIAAALKADFHLPDYPDILRLSLQPVGKITNELRTLSLLARQLKSVEDLLERVAALPALPEDVLDVDAPKRDADGDDFAGLLLQDARTFHVGALVKHLLGGLNIPFHAGLPGPQPLGGVADITNKGKFDKLLVSEFAFEDQVLLSRLANNEALYHHREVPPTDNDQSRIVLIDITLKNWGNVRTIAFAIMAAIVHHPKNRRPCRVFLVGKDFSEIAFTTPDDLIAALQILDSSLDPGPGLSTLFKTEKIGRGEVFFIGDADSLFQPGMQTFGAAHGKAIAHWIHPTVDGQVHVYKNSGSGKRFVQKFELPLQAAWDKRKLPGRGNDPEVRQATYPILFPGFRRKSYWSNRHFTYAVSRYGGLLRNYGRNHSPRNFGWEMIDANFPREFHLMGVFTHADLTVTVLVADRYDKILLWHPNRRERIEVEGSMQIQKQWTFQVQDQAFVHVRRGKHYRIDLTGRFAVSEEGIVPPRLKQEHHPPVIQIFRNIKRIDITERGTFRIGKHELSQVGTSLMLRYNHVQVPAARVEALLRENGVFAFPDGSRVEHHPSGILCLISANPDLPKVYFPSVLDAELGLATEAFFAGNLYYQPESRTEIYFDPASNYGDGTLAFLLSEVCLPAAAAKECVFQGILSTPNALAVQLLANHLDELGIKYTTATKGIPQQVISIEAFYEKHLQAFIDQILSHGA